jgi:hypothetical protein
MLWRFASTYPDVHLEILMESRPIDIAASSFDAGIGRKEWAAADMIAVRVMGPLKVAVVGSPDYFERRRPPRTLDLYYTGHRQVPAALRAFIDMIRAPKSAQGARPLQNPFFKA